MPDDKRDPKLGTDVREQRTNEREYIVLESGDHIGRIRREFTYGKVLRAAKKTRKR